MAIVDAIVKLGGGVLRRSECFDAALAAIHAAAASTRLLVVPGGGPFADAVRDADRRLRLTNTAAHRMAILGMDQYAWLIASRLADASIVGRPDEIAETVAASRIPVLAPSAWLADADPLPHSWDVTSDSIAAWVAASVGAKRLVLIKPAGAEGPDVVDPYFSRACRDGAFGVDVVRFDRIAALPELLA